METLILPAEDQFMRKPNFNGHYCRRKNNKIQYAENKLSENVPYVSSTCRSQNASFPSFPPVLCRPYRSLNPTSPSKASALSEGFSSIPLPTRKENARSPRNDNTKAKGSGNKKRSYERKSPEKTQHTPPLFIPRAPERNGTLADRRFSPVSSPPSSENWAGPAYSNSPPPSCLPLPKFSFRERRSVSLDLPSTSNEEFSEAVKSAANMGLSSSVPASPSRQDSGLDIASATKDLRRILNLDHDL